VHVGGARSLGGSQVDVTGAPEPGPSRKLAEPQRSYGVDFVGSFRRLRTASAEGDGWTGLAPDGAA